MRRSFIITVFLTFIIFALIVSFFNPHLHNFIVATDSSSDSFNKFTDSIFFKQIGQSAFNLHFYLKNPASYKMTSNNYSLGSVSYKEMKASYNYYLNILDQLEAFEYDKLSKKEKLTYDIIKYNASTEIDFSDLCINYQPLSPTIGIQAQLPVLLSQYSFNRESDVIDYLKILSSVNNYFNEIIDFEMEKCKEGCFMSHESLYAIIDQCQTFADSDDSFLTASFDERVNSLKSLSLNKKKKYIHLNRQIVNKIVIPAYSDMASKLCDLSKYCCPHLGLAQYTTGKEYYQYLVRSTTGSDKTVAAIEKMITDKLTEDIVILNRLTKNQKVTLIPPEKVVDSSLDILKAAPKEMINYLIKNMSKDFPTPTSTIFEIKEVPKSLSSYLSPAFYLAPPIDDIDNNIIFINPSDNLKGEELFITLAHEGFPGHLYQTTYFSKKSPSLVRHILDFGGYTEGWATYAELYAYNYLYSDERIKSGLIANSRFSLALYCLADIGINYHGWTLDDTLAFFKKYSLTDYNTISQIYDCMIFEPANYLQYYVGYLEFLELNNYMKNTLGKSYSPLAFHTFVLENGPAPFSILKKYIPTN